MTANIPFPASADRPSRPISAVIITAARSPHLAATLASVEWCDEILLLVSGDPAAVARLPGSGRWRIETHPFRSYGQQKREAVARATHDWILSLDDDEWLDPEATSAILAADRENPETCFTFRRRTFVGRREIRHGSWGREEVLRLFNRTTAGFSDLPVHEQVEPASRPRLLAGSILHHSFTDLADVLARSIRYARPKAEIMLAKGQRVRAWALPWRGLAAFVKSYLLRAGFLDGPAGFVIAISRVIDSTLPRAMVLTGGDTEPADPATGS